MDFRDPFGRGKLLVGELGTPHDGTLKSTIIASAISASAAFEALPVIVHKKTVRPNAIDTGIRSKDLNLARFLKILFRPLNAELRNRPQETVGPGERSAARPGPQQQRLQLGDSFRFAHALTMNHLPQGP